MRNSNMKIRIDADVKKNADAIFRSIGISTSDGIDIFLRRVIAAGGIPFEVKANVPNGRLLAAMAEAEAMENDFNVKRYESAKELFEDLQNEI